MNKNETDFETIKYNYVALKRLHLIANATNKNLNIENTRLLKVEMELKRQIIEVQKVNLAKTEMVTNAYTKINEMQNGYNQVIHDLHTKNKVLELTIKDLANGNIN